MKTTITYKGWEGPVIDFLKLEAILPKHRRWVVLSEDYYTDKELGLFACDCIERTNNYIPNPDPRISKAIEIKGLYTQGLATDKELEEALAAAGTAAWTTARDAARAVGWAAWDAARAVGETYMPATRAAWDDAWDTAKAAELDWQIQRLIEIIEERENDR